MSGSPLSFAATFDGSTPSIPLTWIGADPSHIVLFSTAPVAGFANVVPSLTSHTSTGATVNVPPGWQGVVTVTLLQGLGPTVGQPLVTSGRAQFTASLTATLVWRTPMLDAGYLMLPGRAVVLDGGASIAVAVDGTTQHPGGVTLNADAAFTGYVDVLAFQPGSSAAAVPF